MRLTMYAELPFPLLTSSSLASGTVIAIALNALASALEPPTVDASEATALHFEDTTPLTPAASPTKSMFQISSAALRVKLPASWVIRNTAAVSVVTSTKW
jgi:hypothetical protein